MLGIAGAVIAHPELGAAMFGLDRKHEAVRGRIFGGVFARQRVVEIKRAGGVLGAAHVEQAGEMGEVVGHVRLLKREGPARGRA